MILGIGSDIVENNRIAQSYKRYGKRFLKRLCTQGELEYSLEHRDPIPYLAARFAAKEAAIKALNLTGHAGIHWRDIEVCGKSFGKKTLTFHNQAKIIATSMNTKHYHLSLSHSHKLSMAVVILEGN